MVKAIRVVHQFQHLRLDDFSGAAGSLLQKLHLFGKRRQNDPPLQNVEIDHIAASEMVLLGVEEELVQLLSCYQGGAPLHLVAAAIQLGLDEGG